MSPASAEAIRPAIPDLALRTYRPGDGAALAALQNAENEADRIPWRTTGEEMENWSAVRRRPSTRHATSSSSRPMAARWPPPT